MPPQSLRTTELSVRKKHIYLTDLMPFNHYFSQITCVCAYILTHEDVNCVFIHVCVCVVVGQRFSLFLSHSPPFLLLESGSVTKPGAPQLAKLTGWPGTPSIPLSLSLQHQDCCVWLLLGIQTQILRPRQQAPPAEPSSQSHNESFNCFYSESSIKR